MRKNEKKAILIKDRLEIYKDFVINLIYYIDKYYQDRETLSDDEDVMNHYTWCFKKVCTEFDKEEINFVKNKNLHTYFFDYFDMELYRQKYDDNISREYHISFWLEIFNIENQKNPHYMDILIELYEIFDTSINKKKKILELA